MLAFLTVVALQLATTAPAGADPVIVPAEFRDCFDAARKGKLEVPDDAIEEARRYQYVFVGGFHNERLPGYFAQNAKELRAIGVPKQAIHFIYPSSHETVAGNAKTVRRQFEDIADLGPEKLVVIAHSRGACDTLAFALQNPEFVAEHIHSLFLIQGPFGGTGLADYVVGEGPPIDRKMPLGNRVIAHTLAKAEGFLINHGKHGGLPALAHELRTNSGKTCSRKARRRFRSSAQRRSTSRARSRRQGIGSFSAIASYLETNFGDNDGIVALTDQSLPELGTILAVLDAGHTDLTNRFPSGKAAQRMRKAVVDAIVMAVGRSDKTDSSAIRAAAKKDASLERTARKSRSVNNGRR